MQIDELTHTKTTELLSGLQGICDYICENMYRSPETVWNYALKMLVELTGANAANIRLADEDKDKLFLKASYGVSERYKDAKPALSIGMSIAGRAFESEELYAIEDLRENHRYRLPEYASREGIISLLSAPLSTGNRKLGVLSIYYAMPKKFSAQEKKFFGVLANFLATTFTTHVLHHELQQSYLDIAQTLALTLEQKDSYTNGHSKKVGELAVKIAEQMGVEAGDTELLAKMSALHDIGKIMIDSSILNKPDKLTEQEWTVVKKHPVAGSEILKPIARFAEGLPMIKSHHERYDGKGYPDGLKGDELPLLARIIAVADAYDAMTSDRPYRKKLTDEKARKELLDNADKQFDKKVVFTLLDLLDEEKKCTQKTG